MIEVHEFHKVFRKTVAVADLNFVVNPGEILGLVGPNGAGKTTTLRSISGIIPVTRGTIRVAGHEVNTDALEAKRRLSYVPDEPRLFDALTVWEHLQFSASAYNVPHFEERAEMLLEKFQIMERRNSLAQELSRGMRQKVAVCCAYLHRPTALLFDEPMVGLDPRGIRTLKTSIIEEAARGAAVIISSHMMSLVEDLSTHLLILNRGACLAFGTLAQVRGSYENLSEDASLEDVFFHATENDPNAWSAE